MSELPVTRLLPLEFVDMDCPNAKLQVFLNSLEPDQDSLLSELSRHITDEMLAEIAMQDYGRDPERHLEALRHLRDTGTFTEPMHWYPYEVLELIRNSPPEDFSLGSGSIGVRSHWLRAFACAALLRARAKPWNYGGDPAFPSATLIHLINSVAALPVDFNLELLHFVAWMMSRSDLEEPQMVYFGVGLLWLSLNLQTPPPDTSLIELAEWIVLREAEIRKRSPWAFDRWLLGIAFDPPPSPWEHLGARMVLLELSGRAEEFKDLGEADWSGTCGRLDPASPEPQANVRVV